MKKRLLMSLVAICMAVSGFALTQGEYVYTPQGRFQILGPNVASSNFADLTGWTLVSASTEQTLNLLFNINTDGCAPGINSVQSTDGTAGEGMYFQFAPATANDTYVVSYKMKGAAQTTIRIKTDALKTNLVRVAGNGDGVYDGATDVVYANTAEELKEEWQTFNYAIVGDGTARTYFISFTGMDPSIEIADLQIAPASQFADLRQRDAMLNKLKIYKECYKWDESLLEDMNAFIEGLEAIGNESSQEDLDEALTTAEEGLADFLDTNMDDYLAGNNDNYFRVWNGTKTQKASTYGVWSGYPSGRLFWENNGTPFDLGHYQQTATWAGGSPASPMGVYTSKTLTKGSYVFAIEAGGVFRENLKQTWANDDGMKPCYGIAYVRKMVDGVAGDTIVFQKQDVSNGFKVVDPEGADRKYLGLTPFIINAQIPEDGTYEFGMMIYCKDEYQTLARGSAAYIYNASIWGKNDNKYNQKQYGYEADVREQINTGRDQLTTATENLAKADYFWGKAELKACVDTVEVAIAGYEAMTQDDIIATFDPGIYNKANSTKTAEEGLLVFEVYNNGVRDILAANRKFIAVNDTLNSMQTGIDAANAVLANRLYAAATGADALKAAIATAEGVQAEMKATDYSEENAAKIKEANAALAAAVETFKTTVPASAMTTVVDIDFEQDAVQNAETSTYSVTGAAGTMEFTNWSTDGSGSQPFEQGFWSNAVQMWKGYIRVGNGTGTVLFNAGEMNNDILKVNFDFFLQGLSGRNIGFYLKSETDSIIAGFYANYYNNTIDASSNLPIELGSLQYGSGSTYNNASPEGAEEATATVLPKNSFEVVLDFGEGSIYTTTTSAKGVNTTVKRMFDKTVPTKFVLQSNYNNDARRAWFDNLKIQRIAAGPTEQFVDGIQEIVTPAAQVKAPTKVLKNGRIIINGKYGINGVLIK